ncbi:MAG: transcription-repair coupling factor [Gammaproteobacteria bacterium]|nr:transcription-repair coupling factor [Gammaproteobacteria bacterium]MBT8095005.1 transcription-repair coupling factor [Gammaproteobacteria bacterium]MBT8104675.1 transcription-repair coupling factor [Gammaproteobacteria bacterium]NNK24689.1 transcription-repair coupling factor [Woeseiaceae bacterium]NNL62452.1 transcription-repair coupling factor [Woeseiaceae bacterium]
MHTPLLVPAGTNLPDPGHEAHWGRLLGAGLALAAAELAAAVDRPLLVLAQDPRHADQLEAELRFFGGEDLRVEHFVEWETLPWDTFSPHQDIVSQRLRVLAKLRTLQGGVVIATVNVLQQRLPPVEYVSARSLSLREGQALPRDQFTAALVAAGYLRVPQVSEHGEFAVRGSLIDVFPMGADSPVRIDFFDDDIESLRWFSSETQLSGERVSAIDILPAREVPLDDDAIRSFRDRYRERFEGQPSQSRVYREVSDGIAHGGIEYYLPLFFDDTASLLDYLPAGCGVIAPAGSDALFETFDAELRERHELCRLDPERPILSVDETFVAADEVRMRLASFPLLQYASQSLADSARNFDTRMPPAMKIETRYDDAAASLVSFLDTFEGRVLFSTDSPGRREQLHDMLRSRGIDLARSESWQAFLDDAHRVGLAIAPIESGVLLPGARIAIISEQQLFGERTRVRRRRRGERDPESIIRQLDDLEPGSPVVHEEHGVGRYLGLTTLEAGGITAEFLHLEYADGDKLYVPVHALDLISRYTGASPENAPLHRLGSDQWARAKRRAVQKIRDVAAELLDVYARRAARPGHSFHWPESEYRNFESGFPFELTEDQARTIDDVLEDLASDQPMDRIVCGDVGFGKTEVALRAAFAAVHDGKQVAVLVPTTLLAQQHGQSFRDRFADWPVRVEVLSRFQSTKQAREIVAGMRAGSVDIVIGTHRLLQHTKDFHDVGLVVVDEEHRFGVRHKETIKSLRSEVDILTLTATPIPRTLNMALGGLREMSLITTPPAERLAVKTFVSEWNDVVIREACLREIKRGGQVYFIHNRIEDIERIEQHLEKLVPEAMIRIGHGQMPERDLEQVMLDFSHRRFNVLLCTTIVESGIDVPTANTIVINRADRFGLAQLHQLRGRVGRSHHRAYAYLVAPPRATMTADAIKRLEAIDSLEDLGSGFTLATHDLEIRGAGELLGDVQSGQIQEIGFSLYTELLGRAVESLRAGDEPDLEAPLHAGADINLHVPALLPEDYVPDVHLRLILYKRISAAESADELRDLQVELIDRFGLLPDATKNLLRIAALRKQATGLGVEKIDAADTGGYLVFGPDSRIDPLALVRLVQNDSRRYRLQGSNRLRVDDDLGELERRFATIENLLGQLAVKHEHDS